ncbi:Telomere length regulator rif1 [Fusarium albosuccineum]|uniref:Telomere length regulator rif1 n=1 Tax=Fusarium albosuccineum TaxID=1237068 RepID=A0A8H4KX95_9HYPO|nr:Telomere length regulator rif1 [Fusarium albosuccineum]
MASSAPASNTALEDLPARPPTPPRESNIEKRASMKTAGGRPLDPRLSLHTPPGANTPSTGATNSSSKRIRKKVEWSSHTEYKDPPDYREATKFFRSSPLSTPSSALSKPVKGILKPSPSPNPLASPLNGQLHGFTSQASIAEMLDSTIKQLAGSDRDSRLDAYMMLSRALKASNNLPDRVALQDKMSLFMSFIERDVKSKNDNGSPDASLINHALNLLTTFLHFPAIASTLTSDFGVFILDHCIRCFVDPALPKDLARHLMQVVAFQSFPPKVMTLDRVGRLVTALHKIEDHLTGKSIVMGRIQIYKRLVKQSRNHMAVHTEWLQDMFTDMLSAIRDIRAQAISLGTEAGFALRGEKYVMRKVTEILQTSNDEQTYIEFYIRKLESMLKEKQCLSAVPQIWGVVTLYLQCPLNRWQYYNSWFKLVQDAFNTADMSTKQEANYAWNRYVYLSIATSKAPPKSLSLLGQPLASQLRRKFNSKQADEAMKLRRTVIGGICNLYYYSFSPSHDIAWTDSAWDLILHPIMTQLINVDGKLDLSADSVTQASRIVTGLLDISTPRSWKEDRIREMPLTSPEELPAVDPRWTRRNSEKVFQLVGPILEKKFNDLANKESLAYRLWQAFVVSIAAASAKDIKVTDDTARFIAQSFDILSRMWSQGAPEGSESHAAKFLSSIRHYVDILVQNLGLLPFTEKRLSVSLANTFEPASTPSGRLDRLEKPSGTAQAPVYHLFSMLSSIPPGVADDEELAECFYSVFEPFFHDKSIKVRVELSREMLRLLPLDALSPYGPWVLAAQNIRMLLDQSYISSNSHPSSSDILLGPEYREIVSLLERGLVSHPSLPEHQWFSLFDLLSDHIAHECGDAGRVLGLVEPLAKIVADKFFDDANQSNRMSLAVTTALFKIAKLPRDRQAVEAARRRLWGAPPTASRSSSFDPFHHLYQLQNQSMRFLYGQTKNSVDDTLTASYFEAVDAFILGSFSQTGVKTLSKLQDGLSPWFQDDNAQIKLSDDSPLSKALKTTWDGICGQLLSLGRLEDKDLNAIECLFSTGFKSRHRYVVNKMAETWNTLVKDEESLDCSDSLKSIITSLRPRVDISFPGMEESSGEFGAQAQSFIESQEDLSFMALSSTKSSGQAAEQAVSPAPSFSKTNLRGAMTRKRRRDATPEIVQTKSAKRTSTPRLRHDNSQIQFAPIASSPLAEESQHLTERQKEVRQRQQENAGLYPGIRSSPRTRSRAALEENSKESETKRTRDLESTPERPASYEDFITSTPTPRRGQALHLEDFNDPPSSPPVPRPNPLLSEIRTRSKARNSLENWQFSSPPGTPSDSQQRAESQSEPQVPSTDKGSSKKSSRAKRRRKSKASSPVNEEVIPSSVVIEDAQEDLSILPDAPQPVATEEQKEESHESPIENTPSTPQQAMPPPSKVEVTPKSGDDEFVDARSTPEDVPNEQALAAARELVSSQNQDSSFALSEGEESSFMRFVVELESRRCNLPFDKANSISSSPEKKECIEVQGDSSPEKAQTVTKRPSLPPVIPSTPLVPNLEDSEDQSQSQSQNKSQSGGQGSKRKRKRSLKYAETRRKRRRSADPTASDQGQESQQTSQDTGSPAPTVRRTSRRNAGQKGKKQQQDEDDQESSTKEPEPAPAPEAKSSNRVEVRDGGDTDEELLSQLVTESNAASQTQSQQEAVLEVPSAVIEDSMELVSAEDETFQETRNEEAKSNDNETPDVGKTNTIMDILRGGLNELRDAALSREDVYQLEDMLMDMKRELFEAERRGRH